MSKLRRIYSGSNIIQAVFTMHSSRRDRFVVEYYVNHSRMNIYTARRIDQGSIEKLAKRRGTRDRWFRIYDLQPTISYDHFRDWIGDQCRGYDAAMRVMLALSDNDKYPRDEVMAAFWEHLERLDKESAGLIDD